MLVNHVIIHVMVKLDMMAMMPVAVPMMHGLVVIILVILILILITVIVLALRWHLAEAKVGPSATTKHAGQQFCNVHLISTHRLVLLLLRRKGCKVLQRCIWHTQTQRPHPQSRRNNTSESDNAPMGTSYTAHKFHSDTHWGQRVQWP